MNEDNQRIMREGAQQAESRVNRLSMADMTKAPEPNAPGPIQNASYGGASAVRDYIGSLSGRPVSNLEQRARQTIAEYERSSKRAMAAQRALEILEKNPELGELLSLLGEF